MAQIDRSVQAVPRDVGGVLVGVAQVRVGKPSIRIANASNGAGVPVGVGKSVTSNVTNNSLVVETVQPATVYAANAGAITFTVNGTYTADYDGAFILRATSATNIDVYSPAGFKHTTSITVSAGSFSAFTLNIVSGTAAGTTFTVAGSGITGLAAGDTWIIPVWSPSASTAFKSTNQSGIICPWSTLTSSDSVGGLKSSKLGFAIGSTKKLSAGFPSAVYDQVIDETSVSLDFDSLEFNNGAISTLRAMMNEVINNGNIAAIPLEILCRTRKGDLFTYFVPSANFSKFPEISPTNDFSSTSYGFTALKQTEVTPVDVSNPTTAEKTYNAWLSVAPMYQENRHTH